jgi:hypothetical protein
MTNLTINDIQKLASKRGGVCLSNNYVNKYSKLKWKCSKGHIWISSYKKIQEGRWCRKCFNLSQKDTIEEMQKIAQKHNGYCLSNKYIDSKHKLTWKCEFGHIWSVVPAHIKLGSWCPICARINQPRGSIEEYQKIASNHGGHLLSNQYSNAFTKLRWQCKEGHTWSTTPSNIKRGTWCPYCSGLVKYTIDEVKNIAIKKGGLLLSEKYISNSQLLEWKCKNGHTWKARLSNIVSDHWCPVCSQGRTERLVRKIFEVLFNEKFNSTRPKWLLSPHNRLLELDGYSEKLKLAFEYQGIQHYLTVNNLHFGDVNTLSERIKYDNLKLDLCQKNGVVLIQIPYTIEYNKLQKFIEDKCYANKITIPYKKQINIEELDIYSPEDLLDLQNIAIKHGGKLLSNNFISAHIKLKWQCANGHIWEANASNIRAGKWCRICSMKNVNRDKVLTIEEMQQIATERGGKCLSSIYTNARSYLEWQCSKGHIWKAKPFNIKGKGTWCPFCKGERISNTKKLRVINSTN